MVSLIRDYLDVLSHFSSGLNLEVIELSIQFFFESLIRLIRYIVTFGWLTDIMYLPIIVPKCQQSILSEHFFYEDLNLNFFSTIGKEGVWNFFFLGFLNSLFCCLPFSTTHLIAIRRFWIQGPIAGIASTIGIIVGQCLFIALTILGIRSVVIPWFSLDPLNYVLGIFLLFTIVFEMAHEKRIRSIDLSEKQTLRNICVLSILLTWTEQATISQYLSNLSLTNEPSLLTGINSSGFGSDLSYIIGILIGHIFFSSFFIALTLIVKNSLFTVSNIPYSVWLRRANSIFLIGIMGLSFSSTAYYSLDYLLTGPLGFISQDKALENSIFTQRNVKDPSRLLTSMDVVFPFSIDTDISYFDRGNYGEQPGFFRRNFEELNYQGEYAWLIRRDKKPNLYSSAQTTRTAIRDFLKFDPDQGQMEQMNNVQSSQNLNIEKAKPNPILQAGFGQKFGDRDRVKLRKRYEENYEETRANETYLIGESFNNFPQLDPSLAPLEATLKQKYYTNRVYQTLLNLDIDAFLNRQPTKYQLSEEDEAQIFKKRYLLSKYYDTIRAYQQLPYKDEFQEFFQGSKTFVDRAYNHQFKGSLGIVRRLFAVTLDDNENPAKSAVLKYDQPLFQDQNTYSFVHEDIPKDDSLSPKKAPAFSQWNIDDSFFEVNQLKNSPFLELTDSTPFYLGWDNEKRQMILTKRFYSFPYNEQIYVPSLTTSEFRSSLKNTELADDLKLERIWTIWPLQEKSLLKLKTKPNNQVITLYEPTTNPEMTTIFKIVSATRGGGNVEIFSFPANMRFLNKTPEHLVPNQGGFFWPGSIYDQ